MTRKGKKPMFETITIAWPNADGEMVETDFVGPKGAAQMAHEHIRTTAARRKNDPDYPLPVKIGARQLWKPAWIAEYLLAREHAARNGKRVAA